MGRRLEARPGTLEIDKEGDGTRQIRASDELPTGVTLTGTPVVSVQVLTIGSEPEDWNAAAGVAVSSPQVVDAIADDGTTVLGTSQAVQFTIDADTDPQPDETDTPVPGDNYRVVVTAGRSDGLGDWVGKVPLIIHF